MDIRKYVERMKSVFENMRILGDDNGILDLAKRYLADAEYFLDKGDELRAVEALAISWAYVDALLHLKLVEVADKEFFTV